MCIYIVLLYEYSQSDDVIMTLSFLTLPFYLINNY